MREQNKANNVSVLRVHRSLDNKYKKSSIKKARSNPILHVNIRTLRNIASINTNNNFSQQISTITNNHQHQQKQIKSKKRSKHFHSNTKIDESHHSFSQETKQQPTSSLQLNSSVKSTTNQNSNPDINSEIKIRSLKSSIITPYQKTENEWSNENDVTNDFHRKSKKNKKIKFSRQCIIASIIAIATFIILLILTIVLLVIFIKSKSNRTTPGSIPVLRWNSTGITVAGIAGNPGNATNQLNDPADVILDYENNLYIADRKNHRIQKYLFGSQNGTTVAGNGSSYYSQYQLSNPSRLIIDSNRNLYISDTSNHRIQFWTKDSNSLTTVAGMTNTLGNSSNQLYYPSGIALNPTTGELYILDQFNHRIMSYASGANNGTVLFGGNGGGTNNTQLYYPYGLHFDAFSNSLIIADSSANNTVRYVFGANVWTLVAGDISGFPGNTSTQLNYPSKAIFDPMGNIYVADRNNHRIQFFNAGQLDGVTIAGISAVSGSNATTLKSPRSLGLDSQLNLYVADTSNNRIQKFLRY